MSESIRVLCVSIPVSAAIVAGAAILRADAGDLTPPVGPVSGTMTSLDEIAAQTAGASTALVPVLPPGARHLDMGMTYTPAGSTPIVGDATVCDPSPVSRVFALRSPSGGEGTLTVVKQIDRASPGLHKSICASPGLTEVEIEVCAPDSNGVEQPYLTLTLTNPLIVGHAFIGSATDGTFQVPLEEVTFAYEEAVWVYAGTGETTTVDPCSIP